MQIGLVGLGKMGSRIALKLLSEGHEVIVWNRSEEPIKNLESMTQNLELSLKFKTAANVQGLVQMLKNPRVIWVMLPAGDVTENILKEISNFVQKGDIVIDGGNSNWKDTERRFKIFKEKDIEFLGIGVSGGIIAVKEGYPMMVGGSKKGYEHIKPILGSLAKPKGGFDYFGKGGAGHFVKMVHNAIEYGYMQSIGEGFEVLEKSEYGFDLGKIANLYRKNTLISGFMMDRTAEVLKKDSKLEVLTGIIGKASGETIWTIEEAKRLGIDLEIIEASLNYRLRSETDPKIQKSFTARMVSALRNAFGGHEVKTR